MSVDYRPDYDPADVDHDYGHTGGDITVPTFQGNTKPFKFWCQKTLPLVYDDSLSYYEVLCKMADYLNGFMTDLTTVEDSMTEFGEQFVINQQFLNDMADQLGQNIEDLEAYINDRMDDFMAAYTQLQTYVNNYFDNLDVQEEINSKLDEMASDGTLNDLFDPVLATWMQQKTAQIDAAISNQNEVQAEQNSRISVLEGRMDTFEGLPAGSTAGNAELVGIRTNFLGETYPTAGDAVRASDMIASGFMSIPATKLEEWDGNNTSSVYDTIQIDISGYKGGHVAVIGSFKYFQSDLTNMGSCAVYATNTPGKVEDANAVNYFPGVANSIFKNFTQLTTDISGEERLLLQFAIPDDYTYQYLKIGHFEHSPQSGFYTEPLYIVYANSWSKTPVDPTLSIAGDAADAKAAGDAIDELNERLAPYGMENYNKLLRTETNTAGDVTYSCNNGVYSFSGTASGVSAYWLIQEQTFSVFKTETPFHITFKSTDANVYLQLYKFVGADLTLIKQTTNEADIWVSMPSDATGILLRARATTGATVNGTFTISINGAFTPEQLLQLTSDVNDLSVEMPKKLGYVKVLNSTDDLDDITETGAFVYITSSLPANVPDVTSNAILISVHAYGNTGFVLQTVHTNTGKMYQRLMGSSQTGWFDWHEISAGNGGEQTVIENTYNITTTPTITTDANGWLQAVDTDTADETGKTDMTGPIMSMLTDTGYCHLGEGIFYVSGNIDMPENSMLCGCGKKTIIRLLQSTTNGYCVKIGKYCTIKDIAFEGGRSSVTLPETIGTRHGIAFMANYDASPSVQTEHCMVENVWFQRFTGAGIYCHNTSINYGKGVYVTNAYMYACFAGICIDYYSEFNKFTNVCTSWCTYGCINNGGNNVFTACTFHATSVGFYIDGTQPNSAHGTMNGCTFCHIGNNTGKAILIENATIGFVISNCQVWYNSIEVVSSAGIVFDGCEFGRGTTGAGATIKVTGGDTVMFVGCVFMRDSTYTPDITITDNTKVKFNNCYGSESGNAITA